MTQALILVDLQNDYFPGGAMERSGVEAADVHAAFMAALSSPVARVVDVDAALGA